MGFDSLSFLALIISLSQSSTQGRGDGKRNLIRFLLSFAAGKGAHFSIGL